uniref:Reverse transcriptase domain-containing protein n=1 Tax=Haemonchus contortus TaxID=6289 RepID=A0A7I4XVS2_HAECO
MDLRSGASRSANGQKQGEPGAVDVVLPKEIQEQVEAITKSSRIADGIKKVITAITRELQSLRLENIELRQELDCVRKLVPRESSPVTSVNTVSQDRGRTASGSVPASTEAGLPCQEVERLRSVVISGVPEEKNQNFLGIECNPMCVYRLGRPQIGKDRYSSRRIKDFKQIGCLRRGEVVAFSPVDKANLLADHFESVFQEDDGNVPEWFSPSVEPMKQVPWFIASELYELIMKWPGSCSVTPDFVPFFVVQKIAAVICGPLAYIYNQSLCFGEVPVRWKHSFVTPLLKKEPSWNPENYRPVSITSLFCRLFEKVLKKHVSRHLSSNHIVSRHQHGFTPGLSVETNMIECLDDWTEALDDKLSCDVIYFDFAKAFDRVSHRKLIVKLKTLKFHPIITNWISEYLSDRTFQVKIGQSFSEVRRVISGVPQGGVLSPVLFNVFTAELPDMLREVGVTPKVYADDIKIYKAISVEADSQELQRAIDLTVSWSKDWQLPIAPHKTVYMQLRSCTSPTRTYTVDGVPLSAVQAVRDLGFYYNDRLDFTEHIKTRIRLANLRTFQIFKAGRGNMVLPQFWEQDRWSQTDIRIIN